MTVLREMPITVGSDWARADGYGRVWAVVVDSVRDGLVGFTQMAADRLHTFGRSVNATEAQFRELFVPSEGPTVGELREAARLEAHADASFDPSEVRDVGRAYATGLAETVELSLRREPERAEVIERAAELVLRLGPIRGAQAHAGIVRSTYTGPPSVGRLDAARRAFPTATVAADRPPLPMSNVRTAPGAGLAAKPRCRP